MQRVVIVSHRLPLRLENDRLIPSDGGVVRAIKDSGLSDQALWAGSLGPVQMLETSCKQLEQACNTHGLLNICLSKRFHDDFYQGFCNQVIWPGFHNRLDLINYKDSFWESYKIANHKFAESVIMNCSRKAPIWVQDYHLMLLPSILKKYQRHRKVGFFLHIPWPKPDDCQKIPHLRELAEALCESDFIGFHCQEYASNFEEYVRSLSEFEPPQNFSEKLKVVPVGVGADLWKLSKSHKPLFQAPQTSQVKVIVGVDRFDYSKGIDFKLRAFQELFKRYPQFVGAVRLRQLLIPSRESIPAYKSYRKHVQNLADTINQEYSSLKEAPVELIKGRMNHSDLREFYRSGQVGFVSSHRDGMNLVSMEYLAAQDSRDPGCLVLSDHAGASHYLRGALSFKSGNLYEAVEALQQALEMPVEQRRQRLQLSMDWIQAHTAREWTLKNLKLLGVEISEDQVPQRPQPLEKSA